MLISCGCSFVAGCGLKDPDNDAYGALVARKLGFKHRNVAKHSGSNFLIGLQMQYAAEVKPKFVIVGTTSVDRLDWVMDGKRLKEHASMHKYAYGLYQPFTPDNHPLKDDPEYDPVLLSDSISTILFVLDNYKSVGGRKGEFDYYYQRLGQEPIERLKVIRDYAAEIHHPYIKTMQDRACILAGARKLQRAKVPYLIVDSFLALHDEFEPSEIIAGNRYGDLSKKFPDTMGTLHMSEVGHALLATEIIAKLREAGYEMAH